jgi:alanine racemase
MRRRAGSLNTQAGPVFSVASAGGASVAETDATALRALSSFPTATGTWGGRATRALIDLDAIAANVTAIRRWVGPKPQIMAVVKGNGYGHGIVPSAFAALAGGADWLGVTYPQEGEELRRAGVTAPILLLGLLQPEEASRIAAAGLDQTVASPGEIAALAQAARFAGRKIHVHLKVDTGMGRIGAPPEDAASLARQTAREKSLVLGGVFSHFATADEEDTSFAEEQLERFDDVLARIEHAGVEVPLRHIANSAAILNLPDATYDLVRPGILAYGLRPSRSMSSPISLRPAMTLTTRVAAVKTVRAGTPISYGRTFVTRRASRIAVLPIGYADGLSRRLSGRWAVAIRGNRAPLVGAVCMDACMADVTDVGEVVPGDEVVLFGASPSAEEMAQHLETISYEVLCAVSQRVPRVYNRFS